MQSQSLLVAGALLFSASAAVNAIAGESSKQSGAKVAFSDEAKRESNAIPEIVSAFALICLHENPTFETVQSMLPADYTPTQAQRYVLGFDTDDANPNSVVFSLSGDSERDEANGNPFIAVTFEKGGPGFLGCQVAIKRPRKTKAPSDSALFERIFLHQLIAVKLNAVRKHNPDPSEILGETGAVTWQLFPKTSSQQPNQHMSSLYEISNDKLSLILTLTDPSRKLPDDRSPAPNPRPDTGDAK